MRRSKTQTLRETSAALVEALDREDIYEAVLAGALGLAHDAAGARVRVAIGAPACMTVVASAGDGAAAAKGSSFHLRDLPDEVRGPVLRKTSVAVEDVDPGFAREVMGFESTVASFYYVPLPFGNEVSGLLVVASDGTIARETWGFLDILGSQATMALKNVSRVEDLHGRETAERFQALVQNTSDLVTIVDTGGKILYQSPSVKEILGYEPEELVGTAMKGLIHPEDVVKVRSAFADMAGRPGPAPAVEARARRRDGSWSHIEAVANNLLHDPDLRGILVNSRDVTERKKAEEALKESEERYRAVVEHAVEGIYLVDLRTRHILESNPAFRQMLGRTGEQLSEMTLYDIVAHEPETVDSFVRRISEDGAHQVGELQYRRADGSLLEIEVSASLISRGRHEVLSCVAHDITKRKEAECDLRESEEMFRAVFESAATGVVLTDPNVRFIRVNAALERLLGYDAWELRGKSITDLTHPEDVELTVSSVGRVLSGELPLCRMERRYVRKDGTPIWAHATVSGIKDADGEIRYVLGLLDDITDRKRVEQEIQDLNEDLERRVAERTFQLEATIADLERAQSALRRGEARTRAIVETAPDAIITMTEDGLVRSFNSGAERMFGYGAGEVLGRPLTTLMPERFRRAQEAGLRRYLATGERRVVGQGPVELTGLRKSGTEFPLELALGELREEGEVLFTGIARDIAERKRAEASMQTYARKLRRSNRELQDFAYAASHDLQEPLRKVTAFGDRLRTKYAGALGEQGLDYLGRMEMAAVRMQGLIEDLLSLSRVATQANPFEEVDLAEVVPEVVSDLEARLEQTAGSVEVGELPVVEADRAQIHRLLQNLIGNALKFHKEGMPPDVKVYGEVEGRGDDGKGHIFVEDNGIGFGAEHLERIFLPFERLHGRGAYEGTGIGLAICSRIVERHGGHITATSAPGQGARFTITLPLKQTQEEPAGEGND